MRWPDSRFAACALAALASLAVVTNAVAGAQVSISNGRISIVAKDATVGEILTEWARVGGTKVEHLELLPRDRVTIQLENVTEQQALAVLLRHAGGYMAPRRADAGPNGSVFERILIVPLVVPRVVTANAQAASASAGAAATMGVPAPPVQSAAEEQQPAAAPPQSAAQVADDTASPDEQPAPTPTPLAGEVPLTDAQSQAAIKERRALETADARKFNFPKPQVVIQAVGQPGKPGGR